MRLLYSLGFLLNCLLFAQTEPPKETFTLSGKVVNALTGEPIARAVVQASVPSPTPPAPVLSDAGGVFHLAGLPAGTYFIAVSKAHYQVDPAAQGTTVTLGPSRDDVTMRLAPLSAIEGTVQDRDGMPLQGVSVQLSASVVANGRREIVPNRTATTDDRGHYRLWDLGPGRYYVKAAGQSGGNRLYIGENTGFSDASESFAPLYFGGGGTLSEASPLELQSGQTLRADFSLAMQRAYRVRGTIGNYLRESGVSFELISGRDDATTVRAMTNAAQGTFEIPSVTPGLYKLRATQGQRGVMVTGEADVTVSGANVSGVVLPLMPGASLPVTINCEGTPSPTSPQQQQFQQQSCHAVVTLLGSRSQMRYTSRPNSDKQLDIPGLPPGEYKVQVTPLGGYVTSMMMGGVDVLASQKITVQPGVEKLAALELQMKQDSGTLTGTLAMENKPARAAVLLVPEFPSASGPVINPYVMDGRFTLMNLAPGDYRVYAGPNLANVEYTNPEIVGTLGSGTRVHIDPSQTANVQITTLTTP